MMRTIKSRGLPAAFCLALALTAQPAAASAQEPPHGAWQGPPQGEWIVTAISGTALDNDRSRFELTDGRIAGSSGCNRFTGSFEIAAGGALKTGAMAATKMACPEPFMAQEQNFFRALETAAGWRWQDGDLILTDAAGETVLRLRQAP